MNGSGSEPTRNTVWADARILVTGGGGFIGGAVVRALRQRGVRDDRIVIPRSRTCDLRILDHCRRAVSGCDVVIHLAAPTGGISFSRRHAASQYRDCSLINLHVLEAAREAGVRRFVALGNLLAYPVNAPSPLREEMLHEGRIADTHLGVGQAKRDLVLLAEMYHSEFGMHAVSVLSANAYGPHDRFDSADAHVIPATIAKCLRDRELVVWGDGSPTRDFLFVDDVAEGVVRAAEALDPPQVVNIASGREVSIAELIRLIVSLTGFTGPVTFDPAKGSADPRRVASADRARRLLGFAPRVSLEAGLTRTIDWYRRHTGQS